MNVARRVACRPSSRFLFLHFFHFSVFQTHEPKKRISSNWRVGRRKRTMEEQQGQVAELVGFLNDDKPEVCLRFFFVLLSSFDL